MDSVNRASLALEISRLYSCEKLTMKQISKHMDVSCGLVHKILHEENAVIRTTAEQTRGRKHSPEVCAIISKTHKGKVVSVETRQKISCAHEGVFHVHTRHGGHRKSRFDGYWTVYSPKSPMATADGYVLEHRLVMAEVLSRSLSPTEVVHHINGDRTDNDPRNLMLFPNLRDHQMYHTFLRRNSNV